MGGCDISVIVESSLYTSPSTLLGVSLYRPSPEGTRDVDAPMSMSIGRIDADVGQDAACLHNEGATIF